MRYFIDTEFHEQPCSIDLISIAVVSEDGREYYALNRHCNIKAAWKDDWLRANVFSAIYSEFTSGMKDVLPFTLPTMKRIFYNAGKAPAQIAEDIHKFCVLPQDNSKPEFWGNYADYDWVAFCWLYGRMIDLPKAYPMFCRDLQQKIAYLKAAPFFLDENKIPKQKSGEHSALEDARYNKRLFVFLDEFEHTLTSRPRR